MRGSQLAYVVKRLRPYQYIARCDTLIHVRLGNCGNVAGSYSYATITWR